MVGAETSGDRGGDWKLNSCAARSTQQNAVPSVAQSQLAIRELHHLARIRCIKGAAIAEIDKGKSISYHGPIMDLTRATRLVADY